MQEEVAAVVVFSAKVSVVVVEMILSVKVLVVLVVFLIQLPLYQRFLLEVEAAVVAAFVQVFLLFWVLPPVFLLVLPLPFLITFFLIP